MTNATYSTARYIWLGGAIGLYFGWQFRPTREPSIMVVIGLSLLISIVMLGLSLYGKNRLKFGQALLRLPLNFIQYAVMVSVLELRHFALDLGGRVAVIIFTGIMGLLFGYWVAFREKRVSL
ncbi:MAG: hypothetical protein AAF633_02710 [Chloroflexota bacterium]